MSGRKGLECGDRLAYAIGSKCAGLLILRKHELIQAFPGGDPRIIQFLLLQRQIADKRDFCFRSASHS